MGLGHSRSRPPNRGRGAAGALIAAALLAAAAPSLAQQAQQPPLTIAIDHAVAFTIAGDTNTVLIANPAIADVISERNNVLFVLGLSPGATNLLVYDSAGKRVLEREVVVVPQDARTVTVTRRIDQTDYFCNPHCVFRDHIPSTGGSGGGPPANTQAQAGGGGGAAPGAPAAPAGFLPGTGVPQTPPAGAARPPGG
jgi:hypothetical protein